MSSGPETDFAAVAFDMVQRYDDVSEQDGTLLVHGKKFAYLRESELLVHLSPARTDDLVERGIAASTDDGWVRIEDAQLWPELTDEARTFVGEPAVGGES